MNEKLNLALNVVIAKQMYWDALRKFELATAGPSGEWSSHVNDKVSDEIESWAAGGDPTLLDMVELVEIAEGKNTLKVRYEPCGFTSSDRRPNRINIYGPMLMDQDQLRKTLEAEDIEEVVIYSSHLPTSWHIKLSRSVQFVRRDDLLNEQREEQEKAALCIEGTP